MLRFPKIKNNKGFSLAELLLVVAIIGILGMLLVPNIIAMRKKLHQRELDAKAELIYNAAQNQIIKLRSGGNAAAYAPDTAAPLPGMPQDSADDSRTLYYMSSAERETEGRAAHAVMTGAVVDDELLGNSWVIEYEPESGGVYAVFYSEKDFDVAHEYSVRWNDCDDLRDLTARTELNKVGYYGGDINIATSSTSTLEPTIEIVNGEKLVAYLRCIAPMDPSDPAKTEVVRVKFLIELEDGEGNKHPAITVDDMVPRGRIYSYELVLDDLSSEGTRFHALYPELKAGTALSVRVTAMPVNNGLIQTSKPKQALTNSLFADDSIDTEARIRCARHLQNLDDSSGVVSDIVTARQEANVSFARDDYDTGSWYAYYSTAYFSGHPGYFKPIQNSDLIGYDGAGKSIVGMNVKNDTGAAGLFERFDGMYLDHITLTGAKISGAGAVGALAGTVTRPGSITGCRVYLDRVNGDLDGKTEKDIWISGANAGGLVGVVSGGELTIRDSFAATVLRGTSCAGGLIGSVSGGTVRLSGSYADSYIYGAQLGGLVGGGSVSSLTDCYAAGFLKATASSAGLANSPDGSVNAQRCYTICAPGPAGDGETVKGVAATNVCYDSAKNANEIKRETTTDDLLEKLGGKDGAFQTDTSDTMPYRLLGQALDAYPYPRLKANTHYGDWQADFHMGALVYYEAYRDRTYGFYGANLPSSLSALKVIVGDGYGVVYAKGGIVPETLTVVMDDDNEHPETIDTKNAAAKFFEVKDPGGESYVVYPLPKELTNKAPTAAGFYRRLTITAGTGADASGETYRFNPFFAKTASQMNDASAELPALGANEMICVRTPRHLYAMSLYYDAYFADATGGRTYTQESDIDYSAYRWSEYSLVSGVAAQEPIGARVPGFRANYNGGCHVISHVSFIAGEGKDLDYIGMFGYNAGRLSSLVLATDYVPRGQNGRNYYVQRMKDMTENDIVFIGVLAGYNAPDGLIENCAVAGYYLAGSDGTLHAYTDSTLYAGGLVGGNGGKIQNCSADCPTINVATLYAHAHVGGFAGWNQDTISNCYAIGHIEADGGEADGRKSTDAVHVAGFAGRNSGRVSNSYCATSLITSRGAASHGFAPRTDGGPATNCVYLDKGTYAYAGALHIYSADGGNTTGSPIYLANLKTHSASETASAGRSYYHKNTDHGNIHAAYPYRAVVKNSDGRPVHYGDWQDAAAMGTSGVFYWEHEEGGSNSGYHFTFVGTDEGAAVAGTTLCTAHDDGGVITDFGYGYYVMDEPGSSLTLESTGIDVSNSVGDEHKNVYNGDAKTALEKQVPDYTFYPYTTRKAAENKDYVCLTAGAKDEQKEKHDNIAAGTWKLTYTAAGGSSTSYTYEVAPFFANAVSLLHTEALRDVHALSVEATDGTMTNYGEEAGSKDNRYEIRSAGQLQYINWNYDTQSTDQLVTPENYKHFTYLMYTSSTNSARQTWSEAGNNAVRCWRQTHDADGGAFTGYTPIAGAATSSAYNSYNSVLYAWFGGHYDGQSYKIQDLSIESDSFSVGVFGMTAGANINNVILYGTKDTTKVERKTPNAKKGNTQIGAYSVGALIGVAYDYYTMQNNVRITDNVITNCAVAGYKIVDSSTNQQGIGDANVGGLIGVANVKLERCSAVADIDIRCRHDLGHAQYGSYIRVGGLSGASQFTVTDCYTGGTITVARETIEELYDNSGKNIGIAQARAATAANQNLRYDRNKNTHIYVAGVTACAFSCNYINFTNTTGSYDGRVALTNCYTYMKLPNMEGTIKGVSLVGGPGDRYSQANNNAEKDKGTANYGTCAIVNCYYLRGLTDQVTYTAPGYYFSQGSKPTYTITEEEFREKILFGYLYANNYIVNPHNSGKSYNYPDPTQIKAITYDELKDRTGMLGKLNSGSWGWVTTTESNGASINGKYSFPGGSGALTGKNYPFPTVVRQNDLTYGTATDPVWVNVHYGAWPQDGCYWENGRTAIDVFGDMVMDKASPDHGYAVKAFKLYDQKNQLNGATLTPGDFHFSVDGVAELVGKEFTAQAPDETGYRYYSIPFKVLRDSAVTVTMKWHENEDVTASFNLSLTANLTIGSDAPDPLLLYRRRKSDVITLSARAKNGNDFSLLGAWALKPAEEADKGLYSLEELNEIKQNKWTVTSLHPGSRILEAAFTYDYHGHEFSAKGFIPDHTLGVVGLGGGTSLNEAWRSPTGGSGAEPEAAYGATNAPVQPQGADFFLYETASDEALGSLIVDSVTVKESGGKAYAFTRDSESGAFVSTDAPYEVELESATEADKSFEYRAGTLLYTGAGTPPEVELTVAAHFAMGDEPVNEPYTLTAKVAGVPTFHIVFAPGAEGVTGTMRSLGVRADGAVTLPACRFAKTGYTFAGWRIGNTVLPEGTEMTITPAAESGKLLVRLADDTEFTIDASAAITATWKANTYKVVFDANGGTLDEGFPAEEELEALASVGYDAEFELPKVEYTEGEGEAAVTKYRVTRSGYAFSGWNTEAGGTGADYADGTVVRNLATGGTVTLYAQWASICDLTLVSSHFGGDATTVFTVIPGSTVLAGYYAAPTWNGCTLEGWYSAKNDTGEKVLNADGSIAAAVAGYTTGAEGGCSFQMSANKSLYARWRTDGYLPVDTLGHKGPQTDDFTQYNGTYLIVSEPGAGERRVLADTVSKTAADTLITLTAEPVTVESGTVMEDSGGFLTGTAYILNDGLDAAQWTVTYQNYLNGYLAFSFKNSATDRCLFWDTAKDEPAKVKTGLKETDEGAQWSYNMRNTLGNGHPYCLESRRWVITGGGDSVGWANGAFRRQRSGLSAQPVYLYKLQTIHIFD